MTPIIEFIPMPKIPRLNRVVDVTEKIDGTNASIFITEEGEVFAASRNRWITPLDDHFGFAAWVQAHADELRALGPGHHFGEWWGKGIGRGYGLDHRCFSLFNTSRWNADNVPACCSVVPVLASGGWDEVIPTLHFVVRDLRNFGSRAAPGFLRAEGLVLWHTAAQQAFKMTLEKDHEPKGRAA